LVLEAAASVIVNKVKKMARQFILVLEDPTEEERPDGACFA
jgi:hypothetical protein